MQLFLLVACTLAAGAPDRTPTPAPIRATGVLDGRTVTFPAKTVAGGAKAVVGLLESCSDESPFNPDELKKAEQGDHVRLVFPKPVKVTVMGEAIEAAEVVFRLPANTGVLWVRTGDTVRRYAKYEFRKEQAVADWLREAKPAD